MIDDVFAIEVDVFHQCATILAVENDVLLFARRAAPFHYQPDRVRRALRRMWHARWNEERFALANNVINNAIAFTDPHFDVALELVEILFRIRQMKIIPRVRSFDYHHKKIPAVVKIPVTHGRFELIGVVFDPVLQINGRLDFRHKRERILPMKGVKRRAASRYDSLPLLLVTWSQLSAVSRFPGRP